MAAIIGANFFAPLDENTRVIFTLLAFAAGFAVPLRRAGVRLPQAT